MITKYRGKGFRGEAAIDNNEEIMNEVFENYYKKLAVSLQLYPNQQESSFQPYIIKNESIHKPKIIPLNGQVSQTLKDLKQDKTITIAKKETQNIDSKKR